MADEIGQGPVAGASTEAEARALWQRQFRQNERAAGIDDDTPPPVAGGVKADPETVSRTVATAGQATENSPASGFGDSFVDAAIGSANGIIEDPGSLVGGVATASTGFIRGTGETISDTYNNIAQQFNSTFGNTNGTAPDVNPGDGTGFNFEGEPIPVNNQTSGTSTGQAEPVDAVEQLEATGATEADIAALAADNGIPVSELVNYTLDGSGNLVPIGGISSSAKSNNIQSAEVETDWRVKLTLAPNADYLYKATDPGILEPLRRSDGLIFPYTPEIQMQHKANYDNYDLVHSNYRGYYYTNSVVDNILINATFTAQDTEEANYMLAALHFLRSCTKMFYGLDARRGTPPPVVFLTGLGEYQFVNHPCVVTIMNYNMPNDVDYIAAGPIVPSTPEEGFMHTLPPNSGYNGWSSKISTQIGRMTGSNLPPGANPANKTTQQQANTNSGDVNATSPYSKKTYVPTKIDITFSLVPIQTRKQVSTGFSLGKYATGDLIKNGYW